MLFEEFSAALDAEVAPVYAVKGEDDYWMGLAYAKLVALCDSVDLAVYGAGDSVADALAGAECFPFVGERRVVVLQDFAFEEGDKKRLTEYIASPPPTTVLVLYRCSWAPKGAIVCEFDRLKPYAVEKWIASRCAKEGFRIDSAACHLLVEYCDSDAARCDAELQKLKAYADGSISAQHVREAVVPNDNYQVYAFGDKVSRGDYVGAMRVLDSLIGTASDYPTFLGLLINHYRMAYYRKISALSDEQLGKVLGGKKAFAVKKAGETARHYTPTALYRLLQSLYQAEYDFKSGRITPEQALQTALVQAIERRTN